MTSPYLILAIVLLLSLMVVLELGRQLGLSHTKQRGSPNKGSASVEAAVFALFGLLLAFTFSGAATRFEHRRDLVVQEANSIGTAYLRIDLLDRQAQEKLYPLFKSYVQSRLDAYQSISSGQEEFKKKITLSSDIQNQIWQLATEGAARAKSPSVMNLVLPPINDMIDITSTRLAAMRNHPPPIIFVLLVAFSFACALIAGYSMSVDPRRNWLHMILFTLCVAGTIYVILDLEYPRYGFIRVDGVDVHLQDLLDSMSK
jgi:hypothetical protein